MFFPQRRWIYLFMAVFSGVASINVNIREDIYEHLKGDDVVLPCQFQTRGAPKLVIVSWLSSSPEGQETIILTHYHPVRVTDINSVYEGRVSLDVNVKKGKANLKLSSVTAADQRSYECRVLIPGEDEGRLTDSTRLLVYAAPSKPVCQVQGTSEFGQNINLTCSSEEGSPPPLYRWERRDVRSFPRMDPRTTDRGGVGGGVLSLYQIDGDTSGDYVCTSRNKVGSASCRLALTVQQPGAFLALQMDVVAGALTGALAYVGFAAGEKILEGMTDLQPGNNSTVA